jgi:hypothetical protein
MRYVHYSYRIESLDAWLSAVQTGWRRTEEGKPDMTFRGERGRRAERLVTSASTCPTATMQPRLAASGLDTHVVPPTIPAQWPGQGEPHESTVVLSVLEAARAIVATGWVQGDYFLVRTRGGRITSVGPLTLISARRADIVGACLVGALTAAARRNDPRLVGGSHLRAIDATWDALQEQSGRPAPVTGPGSSPAERALRVRDLTHFNDAPGRQPQDVVGLLDTAISRAIMTAVQR